jgi:hypothetical protein
MFALLRFRWSLFIVALAALCLSTALAGGKDKDAKDTSKESTGVVVDKQKRTITLDAKIAPRKIDDPRYKEIYPIEVVACWAFPKGQKAHETVVTFEAIPSAVHKGLVELGLKPGKPVVGDVKEEPEGPTVNIYLEFPGPDGEPKRVPIEKTMIDPKGKNLPKMQWRFTGSVMSQPDPNKAGEIYGADLTGTLIAIFPVTNQTVFQTNFTMKEEKYVKLETDKKLLPKEGADVKLILEVPEKK